MTRTRQDSAANAQAKPPLPTGLVFEIRFPNFTPRITIRSDRELTVKIVAGKYLGFSDTTAYEATTVRDGVVFLSGQEHNGSAIVHALDFEGGVAYTAVRPETSPLQRMTGPIDIKSAAQARCIRAMSGGADSLGNGGAALLRLWWLSLLIVAGFSPLAAHAQDANLASVWSAPASVSVSRREVTFRNGDVTLKGDLYLPATTRKVPVIVVFHAATVATRDLPLFRHLTQMMPPLGIGVLVFDRRGSGASGGQPASGGYNVLADDGCAALRMLTRDPRVDPKRIGFWGLSQGGWISTLAASRCPGAAFAISVSAPMTTPAVQMDFAVANVLRIDGYSQADIDQAVGARDAVDAFEHGALDRATAQRRLDAAAAQPWFPLIYMEKTFHDPAQSGWPGEMWQDPIVWLQGDKAPTLIVYGAKDPWVPVAVSLKVLRARAAQFPNVTTEVVAGADHDMMLSASPKEQVDPKTMDNLAPDDPAYFALLASWLTHQGLVATWRR
ncbi:MAG TPA: alpha/beta fold hydrolase [Caulobacteraceae bacterium]|jgi:hypothetical protein